MLCKCSGKYIDIYFNLKITYYSNSNNNNNINSLPLSVSVSERRSEKNVFLKNSQWAEFLKLRVHFWLLFLSMFEFYPASIRNGK